MEFSDCQAQIELARDRENKANSKSILNAVGMTAGFLLTSSVVGAIVGVPMVLYFGYQSLKGYKEAQNARSDITMLRKAQEQSLQSPSQQARADSIARTFGTREGPDTHWAQSANTQAIDFLPDR